MKDGNDEQHLIRFGEDTTKARKARVAVVEADLFKRLQAIAGQTYLWESYAADIAKYLEPGVFAGASGVMG